MKIEQFEAIESIKLKNMSFNILKMLFLKENEQNIDMKRTNVAYLYTGCHKYWIR